MIRDLRAYFKLESDSKTSVGYELLEDGTYGGGKSFPHYCVWVYIYDGNKVLEQGIAAVAAENKQRFDVTKYISKEEIKKNPKAVAETFPPILCPEIIDRAKRP